MMSDPTKSAAIAKTDEMIISKGDKNEKCQCQKNYR